MPLAFKPLHSRSLATGCDLAATQPHYNEIELHSGEMANRIVATQSEVHLEHHSAKYRIIQNTFSHHYQGRIDFNTSNLFHSAGMDLACILASREGLTNPLPRGKIDQSSP